MKSSPSILAFNRGMISRLALARVDLKRMGLSAESQVNFMPRVSGSMMLRPGLQYIGQPPGAAKMLPFVFSTDDTALIEVSSLAFRVWVNDAVITRPSVTTTITNSGFDTDIAGWTTADESGALSAWQTGGYLRLTGNGTNSAVVNRQITVLAADQGIEHALRIIVNRGPVGFLVGSALGGDQYVSETLLGTGVHSLAFTPTGNFHIQIRSRLERIIQVDSIQVESAGAMSITAPWAEADLTLLRTDQSGDVLFIAAKGYQQRRIERRSTRSWSIVLYEPENGPFRTVNTTATTISASAITFSVTLTASNAIFKSTQVGGLIRLTSQGQSVQLDISAQNTFGDPIRVIGVGESRRFTITIAGTFVGTVTVQRSIGEVGTWTDVTNYTAAVSTTYADDLDNQIVFYRIGIKTGNYTSGTAQTSLDYPLGSITGVVRITAYTSSTVVVGDVLSDLGGTDATDVWAEGAWSGRRGYPSSVAFYEGRLWWSGKNGMWGSISDAFDSFDPDFEGDAGPISRTIGSGPVDDINWLLAMQRLIIGAEGAEMSARSTSFDEPLTPSNFNIKEASTQGSAAIAAIKVDSRGVFVQRSGSRVYELAYDVQINDYSATDLTAFVPEIGEPRIVAMAVQRQPDTRIHCVLSDGTVAINIYDPVEKILCWIKFETDGVVEDVTVLPGEYGDKEDQVYYLVNRADGSPSGDAAIESTTSEEGCVPQDPNTFLAGPVSGDPACPTWRVIDEDDLPAGGGVTVSISLEMPNDQTTLVTGSPANATGTFTVVEQDFGADSIVGWDDSQGDRINYALGDNLKTDGTTMCATGDVQFITSDYTVLHNDRLIVVNASTATGSGETSIHHPAAITAESVVMVNANGILWHMANSGTPVVAVDLNTNTQLCSVTLSAGTHFAHIFAVDSQGRAYGRDVTALSHLLWRFNLDGTISKFDSGADIQSEFQNPSAYAFDERGNLWTYCSYGGVQPAVRYSDFNEGGLTCVQTQMGANPAPWANSAVPSVPMVNGGSIPGRMYIASEGSAVTSVQGWGYYDTRTLVWHMVHTASPLGTVKRAVLDPAGFVYMCSDLNSTDLIKYDKDGRVLATLVLGGSISNTGLMTLDHTGKLWVLNSGTSPAKVNVVDTASFTLITTITLGTTTRNLIHDQPYHDKDVLVWEPSAGNFEVFVLHGPGITLTLDDVTIHCTDREHMIKKSALDLTTNGIVVVGAVVGGVQQLIDGVPSQSLYKRGDTITPVADGTNWQLAPNDLTSDPPIANVVGGKETFWIPAKDWTPSATGGCAALVTVATTANCPDVTSLDFDKTTQEYAQCIKRMPQRWDRGTFSFVALWSHAATTTNFAVTWSLEASISRDGITSNSFGTAVTKVDTGGTTDNPYFSDESNAVTPSGLAINSQVAVTFRVSRVPSSSLNIDARLQGVTIYWTSTAVTDD